MTDKKTDCISQRKTALLRAIPGKTLLEKSQAMGFANQGSLSRWKNRKVNSTVESLLMDCFDVMSEERRRIFIEDGLRLRRGWPS